MAKARTTRTVNIRTFRAHLTQLIDEAREKDIHFIVMRHSEPIAHLIPMKKFNRSLEEIEADIAEARRQAARGEGYTPAQARRLLGL
ncbi:MAG: type II toxin-antitoxin system Phd/YefM family antitoxin [Candidatus Peribacteraceae bacterium]|nr:type II toxin-antitoxin system Phd/YefM family antitoxin [Candidatus Peribacteraceae bacterium]